MSNVKVGAGILNIITESLYDNPIVVFREYVQNSVDSIFKLSGNRDINEIRIWNSQNNLFFLDNGQGISREAFREEMVKIGASTKKKQRNLGYKGIGRLSGVPYCNKLIFVNICNYIKGEVQLFTIDGVLYEQIKNDDSYSDLSFSELMGKIGKYESDINLRNLSVIYSQIEKYDEIMRKSNTGFLVFMENISPVLKNTIEHKDFFVNLQWLLPVDFASDLYESDKKELFEELTSLQEETMSPVQYCNIFYNDCQIFRPIQEGMLRDYVCKVNFKYAVGFHTFKGDRIAIDSKNTFSGIKIYIDNMLLCEENELLQSLENYGLLTHTLNGQLQSVKGIGAMIYITDKVNISANARRTFIEVTDNDSLDFLKMLAEFVNTIYDTRYALSNYVSAKSKYQSDSENLKKLKNVALEHLRKLAKENVELTFEEEDETTSFLKMNDNEKKRIIKRTISHQLDKKLKEYLNQLTRIELQNAYESFFEWLKNNL